MLLERIRSTTTTVKRLGRAARNYPLPIEEVPRNLSQDLFALTTNVNNTAPTGVMAGQTFEVDELYQNAGEKKYAPSRPERSTPPSRE